MTARRLIPGGFSVPMFVVNHSEKMGSQPHNWPGMNQLTAAATSDTASIASAIFPMRRDARSTRY